MEIDRASIRERGFGFGRVPPASDLKSNQGKLAQARAAMRTQNYGRALVWLQELEGKAAMQSGKVQSGLKAWKFLTLAQRQLDDWIWRNLDDKVRGGP